METCLVFLIIAFLERYFFLTTSEARAQTTQPTVCPDHTPEQLQVKTEGYTVPSNHVTSPAAPGSLAHAQ